MKAWFAFKHTTGIRILHTRGIILIFAYDLQLIVVVQLANRQSIV